MYYLNALGDVITDEPSLDEMSLRYKIRSLSLMYCKRRRKESELIFVHFDVCKKMAQNNRAFSYLAKIW